MATTISLYNHTAARFASGANAVNDIYKLKLLTAATFDATHATLAATGGTEVVNAGYTAGGEVLIGATVLTVNTNDAALFANDVIWTASGGPLSAACAILYNDSDSNDPPVAFIDFGGTETAGDATQFKVVWGANGIVTWTVS